MKITKSKIKLVNIALLCAVLLAAQFFALAHSVEHNFHEAEASCEVFATVERSGNAVLCDSQAVFFGDFSSLFLDSGQAFALSQTPLTRQARAPPQL